MTPRLEHIVLVDSIHVSIRPSVQKTVRSGLNRWLVKWVVKTATEKHDKTRSFETKAEADGFHTDLKAAKRAGERWDPKTGLPASKLAPETPETFLDVACELVETEWASWSPGNRRARVEALARLCSVLVDDGRGNPGKEMLRTWAFNHELPIDEQKQPLDKRRIDNKMRTVADQQAAGRWLVQHSLPIAALADTLLVNKTLTAVSKRLDGKQYGPETLQKNRSALSLVCMLAVEKKLLVTSPVKDTKRRVEDEDTAVDPATVPSPTQARELIAAVCDISAVAERQYKAYLTLLSQTGMRPSEATGINHDANLVLPETGWGSVVLSSPTVHPGKRWTTDGEKPHEDRKKLKARRRKETRKVILPPETVAALREHIEVNGIKRGARLFVNSKGKPIDPSSMSKVWRRARETACEGYFDGTETREPLTVYELRHTAASTMLTLAGISVPRVAAQLGNSPAVLMRRYARVMDTDDQDFMDRMDVALARE